MASVMNAMNQSLILRHSVLYWDEMAYILGSHGKTAVAIGQYSWPPTVRNGKPSISLLDSVIIW